MQQPQTPKAKVSGSGVLKRADGTVKTDHVVRVPAPPTEQPKGEPR